MALRLFSGGPAVAAWRLQLPPSQAPFGRPTRRTFMRFRCVALIALWTMLSGPVFGPPVDSSAARRRPTAATAPAPDSPPDDPDADLAP
jgi:hypothetical protein